MLPISNYRLKKNFFENIFIGFTLFFANKLEIWIFFSKKSNIAFLEEGWFSLKIVNWIKQKLQHNRKAFCHLYSLRTCCLFVDFVTRNIFPTTFSFSMKNDIGTSSKKNLNKILLTKTFVKWQWFKSKLTNFILFWKLFSFQTFFFSFPSTKQLGRVIPRSNKIYRREWERKREREREMRKKKKIKRTDKKVVAKKVFLFSSFSF